MIVEPPKPRKGKKQRAQFAYDDDSPFLQDNTAFVFRIKISSTDLLRNGISALKWFMSSMRASMSMDRDQSPQSMVVASISNVPRETCEQGLETTANFYLDKSKEALGRKGKLTSDQIARQIPPLQFRFRI